MAQMPRAVMLLGIMMEVHTLTKSTLAGGVSMRDQWLSVRTELLGSDVHNI